MQIIQNNNFSRRVNVREGNAHMMTQSVLTANGSSAGRGTRREL